MLRSATRFGGLQMAAATMTALLASTTGVLGADVSPPPLATSPGPSAVPGQRISAWNDTDRTVTVYLGDEPIARLEPSTLRDPIELAATPPLPWSLEVRDDTEYLLVSFDVPDPGPFGVRTDLSCGRIDVWSVVPILGPMNGPGVPGDCGPGLAGPEVVLDAYLRALRGGDCESARKLTTDLFRVGNGDLCGATVVSAWRIHGAAQPSGEEVVFATELITSGTADGSIEAGEMTWFYDLVRQPTGAWRIVGGGSGP